VRSIESAIHEQSADTESTRARVDYHLGDFAAMRLVRRHRRDQLNGAEKFTTPHGPKQNCLSCGNLGQDISRPKACRIVFEKAVP
jgi:hypothetical protein